MTVPSVAMDSLQATIGNHDMQTRGLAPIISMSALRAAAEHGDMVKMAELCRLTKKSRPTIKSWMRELCFPPPIQIGRGKFYLTPQTYLWFEKITGGAGAAIN